MSGRVCVCGGVTFSNHLTDTFCGVRKCGRVKAEQMHLTWNRTLTCHKVEYDPFIKSHCASCNHFEGCFEQLNGCNFERISGKTKPAQLAVWILSKWTQRGKNRGQVRHGKNIFPEKITFSCHLAGGGCYFGITPCLR